MLRDVLAGIAGLTIAVADASALRTYIATVPTGGFLVIMGDCANQQGLVTGEIVTA
jgi:hypothetical protein